MEQISFWLYPEMLRFMDRVHREYNTNEVAERWITRQENRFRWFGYVMLRR